MFVDARRAGAREEEIGLTRYATATAPLGGRLKTRIEDFTVDEVGAPPIPDANGPYAAARIRLTNWETNAFVKEASHRLGISRKKVHYSGTKDKRGVTEQWFTFEAPSAAVQELGRTNGVEVIEVVRTKTEAELGDHVANRFHVVVRGIDHAPAQAERLVAATWKELEALGGAPNVFGPQRFGARRATTHKVGERIVRGDFMGAVRAYLDDPLTMDAEKRVRFREALDARGWQEALGVLDQGDVPFERAILHRLIETDDPLEAILALAPNLQRLFVHAYQSWIFNRIVLRRLERGLPLHEPVEGDLVAPIEDGSVEENWVPVVAANRSRAAAEVRRGRAAVTALLPGTEAPVASGAMGDVERSVLAEEKLLPADFLVPERLDWSSRGTRRAIIAPIRSFTSRAEPDDLHPGKTKASLSFELPAGSYATSVLREFMKSPRLEDYA